LDEPIRFPNLYGTDRITNVEINIGLDGHDLFGRIKSSSITLKGRLVRIFNNPLDYMPVNLADKDGILVGEAFINDQGLEDDTHVYCLLVWTSNKYNYHGGPDDDASTYSEKGARAINIRKTRRAVSTQSGGKNLSRLFNPSKRERTSNTPGLSKCLEINCNAYID
jgi:hypothetical protein